MMVINRSVVPGLVPGTPLRKELPSLSGSPGIRAFTPVLDGLCPAMTIYWSSFPTKSSTASEKLSFASPATMCRASATSM